MSEHYLTEARNTVSGFMLPERITDCELADDLAEAFARDLAAAHRAGKLESLREIEQATFARWASVDDVRRAVRARIAEIENEGKE
jgi:hypothetical protein